MSIVINGQNVESKTAVREEGEYGNYGVYHISEYKQLYEPQRSTDFRLVLSGLKNLANRFGGSEYQDIENTLSYAVYSCTIPHFTIQPLELRMGNSSMKFAGTPTWKAGTIQVRDFIGANTKSILMAWQNEAYNQETDKVGTLDQYHVTAWLEEYTPDRQIVRQYKLYNCWISDISEDAYNRANQASIHDITCTLEYDRAELMEGSHI